MSRTKRKLSTRREFLKAMAAGGAAVLGGAVTPLARAADAPADPAAAVAPRSRAGAHPATPAVRKEIQSQKDSLAKTLKTIRDYKLETGSPQAFVFKPVRATRSRSTS